MERLVAARHQGIPQSSVGEGACLDPGEGVQQDNHSIAHWSAPHRRLWGEGAPRSLSGSSRLDWSRAVPSSVSARPLVAHHVFSLLIVQQTDGHQP